MPPRPALTLPHWLRSRLFRSYLRSFLLLWLLVKGANAFLAAYVGLPPFGFRLGSETLACLIELVALVTFVRRSHEDILLANLGLPFVTALAPLVPVHIALSLAVAGLA